METVMVNEHQEQSFSEEKGTVLLELARKTIAARLGIPYGEAEDLTTRLQDKEFENPRGTFVTLKIKGRLRGCIGNLNPDKPLSKGVRDNALNAAFHDPRFTPLSPEEFNHIRIEVSLLTEPQLLEYAGADDLLAKLTPHVDGLIIRRGSFGATFLPQVWEQLPDKKLFLRHLCLKAGLPADAWQKGDLQVFIYRVQYFEEGH